VQPPLVDVVLFDKTGTQTGGERAHDLITFD
jgi:cation transport ATPase